MGTWDTGSFGNDMACDWSYGLKAVTDFSYIESALDRVLGIGVNATLPADVAECGVAAAEVVARLRGDWGEENSYTETVDQWVRSHPMTVPPALLAKAIAALDRVVSAPSELLDLWAEADAEGWTHAVVELKQRLQRST